ncbi:DNA-binding transcriptional regulator, MocR family, contains an aminotransferase domain [Clostridium cavendishii DSM 21758]|uniref:HTH-type transcriptional regulator NorG n=1 Tax=Clostridium cavendishii DSM 21758 TaxID=1121302 RepID=A0A1M6GU91_9CLOT|nr:PLP-dependent aminotransferase family protein [Clostridium cavendishii]SHJ13548.1 DNA-binding transcriptional regulator, MocR family, contains an aminotransferase domain [Clostridium cavendishii DSM 21758]
MRYKYEEVIDLIKENIYSGNYKPGEKLPSIQKLSKELNYNTDTIVKAYKQLEEEHLIYVVSKSGYYVMKNEDKIDKDKKIIDMLNIYLPDKINPYKDFYHCMDKAISIYGKKLFEYSSPKGMPELINVLVKHLMDFQIFTNSENIFITNGSQQALYILGAMSFPGGKSKVLLEQPTYSVMLKILENAKIPAIGIKRTQEGIDLNELETIFKQGDIKFFYIMPRYQNPTGFSYSNVQKKEIIRLAEKYDVYILEDDYLLDLELNKKSDSVYAMANGGRCIYIRSFSKTLLPGLRLGMIILPKELQQKFIDFKYSIDLNTSILTQGALEIYLKSNMYKFHVRRTREFYRNKMEVLKKLCDKELRDKVSCYIPETGLYAYIETKEVASEILEKSLLNKRVLVSSTRNCYLKDFKYNEGIRLCVSNASDEDIRKAVNIIKLLV